MPYKDPDKRRRQILKLRTYPRKTPRNTPRDRERNKERSARSYERHFKGRPEVLRDKNLRKKFGISLKDYNSMIERQAGRCLICGQTGNHGGKGLAVDHCHDTGRIRGLLCCSCNGGLGMFKDNIAILKSAIAYLEVR